MHKNSMLATTAEGYQDSKFVFPFKMYNLLEEASNLGFEYIISWVGGRKSFRVHDRGQFVGHILPMYFEQTWYKSFQCQLNHYQFTSSGPYKGMSLRLRVPG
jgi:hypothetical protein